MTKRIKLMQIRVNRMCIKKRDPKTPLLYQILSRCQPMEGATSATSVTSAAARSSGKLCAFLSCITSIPRFALLRTSAHVGTTRPELSRIDWLKLNPLRLNAMVEIPIEVNHTQTTGKTARKK